MEHEIQTLILAGFMTKREAEKIIARLIDGTY